MKYIFLMLAITGLSILNAQENDRIEGFRGIKWGHKIDSIYKNGEKIEFKTVELNNTIDDGTYTIIPGENKTIGSITLENIYYVFSKHDHRLHKVVLEGKKKDVEAMEFIVDYKYGKNENESKDDDKVSKQWIVHDVTMSLYDFNYNIFKFVLESDWESAEAYRKNISVFDF